MEEEEEEEEEEENYSSISTSSSSSNPNSPLSPTNSISSHLSSSLKSSYTFSNEIPYNSDSNSQQEISSYKNPSKYPKTHQPKIPIDRISSLPDPLLFHILSFLPTENAITTSFLSKRWQHLWASFPNLTFHCRRSWKEGLREFIGFVNGIVRRYGSSNLKKFSVDFDFLRLFADRISVWIRFATRHNVEEIELNLHGDQDLYPLEVEQYILPQYVFDYPLVKVLKLRFCEIAPTREITWNRLKTLLISYARLSNDLVKKILKGSPVLEHLELYKCGGISCLDVEPSSSLKKIVVNDYWDSSDFVDGEVLEISGHKLRSLGLLGFLYWKKFKVRNVSGLVDVNLNFQLMTEVEGVDEHNDYEEYRSMLMDFMDNLHHVAELTIGTWCIQLLSVCELKGFHSPLLKCKHLILDTCISAWDLPGIAYLLRGSPDLETFVINMTCSFNSEFGFGTNFTNANNFDEKSFWTSKEVESKSWLLKLRTIKIVGFIADLREINFVLLLLQFLLKNARALEHIIIYIQNHNPNRWWMHSKPEDILKVEKCLRSFPRSSPQVEITLHHMNDS